MLSKKKKICLISSSGGHFEQLLMLKKLNDNYDIFIVTEKTSYNKHDKTIRYFISQVNRKEFLVIFKVIGIFFKSLYIYFKTRPDVIISTGALATIPMLCIGRFFGKKIIFIESFAKINTPTMTGQFVYNRKLADQFYVQWESMIKFYPTALYKGGIY